jgi:general secretion pathway protein D
MNLAVRLFVASALWATVANAQEPPPPDAAEAEGGQSAAAKRKSQYEAARKKAIEAAKENAAAKRAAGEMPPNIAAERAAKAKTARTELAQAPPPAEEPKPSAPPSTSPAATKEPSKVELSSCRPASGKLAFNFEKATINEVLDQISRIKCMNFILSDAVKGKTDITIISRSAVTVAQAYSAFLSALEANGMALVPAGAFFKVVERKESARTTIPMYEVKDGVLTRVTGDEKREGELPNSDAQVTLLYEIRFANREQVHNLVRNLMSKNGDLQTPVGSLFILTDSGSNILRILEVLDKIDIEGTSNRLNVVSLKWADVATIAQKLNEIFGIGAAGGEKSKAVAVAKARRTAKTGEGGESAEAAGGEESDDISDVSIEKIIPDDRSNQLLVISSPKAFDKVLEVLRILDVPIDPNGTGEVKMWVVALANMDAQKAEATLSALASGSVAKKPAAEKGGIKAKEQAAAASLFEGEVKVKADETTNSLVIVASGRDFRALKTVIEKLDVRRPQVFVEAAIMEVALRQDRDVGLNAYASAPVPTVGGTGIGVVANEGGRQLFQDSAKAVAGQQALAALIKADRLDGATAGLAVDAASDLSKLLGFLAFQGPGIEIIPGLPLPSVGAVVNLLQRNANVDILSTPHIMTTDNEKAEISVGQRVPVNKGSTVGGGALGLVTSNVTYEDVKLKFSITPHVNSQGEVRIELEQEVSDLGGNVAVGPGQTAPIITNRNVKNTVVARDQQTIAIAGLISDKKGDTESKVPFFGDIPIIGWLFKTWSDEKTKTNLLIVLTPYIVRDDNDFRKIFERKMRERSQFVEAYFSDARIYNPYIDYDKKTGPVGELVRAVDYEMDKIENGGDGHGEELIMPGDATFKGGRAIGGGEALEPGTGEVPPPPPDGERAPEPAPTPPPGTLVPAEPPPAPPPPIPEG